MKRLIGCIIFILLSSIALRAQSSYPTPFDSNQNQTATYAEAIAFYEQLAADFPSMELQVAGSTDAGQPLHLAILSPDKIFDPMELKAQGKTIVMINNAIHAGEACGVDATMGLFRDLLLHPEKYPSLANTVLIAIPVYNIGGALNRNSHTRTNQNGPEAYGFRGNAKNLDLNRDFIKCDSKNARSFNLIFQTWQPAIFIDNHTSNGADYSYTITIIPTQAEKLGGPMADFQQKKMMPFLYADMKKRDWEMTPYVYARTTPDEGIAGFLDLARYSSGYAALSQCLSFMPETHMLKPYADRVLSTRAFSLSVLEFAAQHGPAIQAARKQARESLLSKKELAINWSIDREKVDSFLFKGYTAKYKPSVVTGQDRLYYDRSEPYEKWIPWYNSYKATESVNVPRGYIIPQAYEEVLDRLSWNGIELQPLQKDTIVEVEMYRIMDYKSSAQPYEGHYLHRDIQVEKIVQRWQYYAGDIFVPSRQAGIRYIVETLEPMGPDSFFAWNFFDGILMQKEHFSAYVFEDLAAAILLEQPSLRAELTIKKNEDPAFAKDAYAQLNYIYQHSDHYEKTHRLYPVARLK